MVVGFTGTRKGMTIRQRNSVRKFLDMVEPVTVRHGDCIGCDEEFHEIARDLDLRIEVHPPWDDSKAAYCQGDVNWPRKPYLARNHDIVDMSDMLLACPRTRKEQRRSGTWATIRYARRMKKPALMIDPEGKRWWHPLRYPAQEREQGR